ncbi:mannose-ethanolamine phosphotransferase LAS21 [Sporobolomyces salmoneus]|uniref:mannose-ethanolamine phosphotransferase LAS21 n=1 Tax=Sporobolomyces salmoneus TaxID=183962 RepID=UPI003175A19F
MFFSSQSRFSLAILLSSFGIACFFRGFFPLKPLVPGYTEPQRYSPFDTAKGSARDEPFSRLVFMLVDALRSDFAFAPESEMKFVQSLIAEGHALPYTAIAQPPTVTLPRLKGLTTGSNPTFLDAILNIADEGSSSAALEHVDSWVRQLVHRDDKATKLVFAGDDTWLRLFPPSWFDWSEGVSSFFVSDTHIVDSNVTRHLDSLLSEQDTPAKSPPSDWDVLIFHYLGLDHVGHLEGPKSPLMAPKQREMDGVLERLYQAAKERDERDGARTLLVLVGDHGMSESGNHGGSTESETSSALLLAAPSLHAKSTPDHPHRHSQYRYHEVVQQVDLVPTLSVLFDLGIPKNSMGRLIASAVQRLRPSAFAHGLIENVKQMTDVLEAAGVDSNALLCRAANRFGRPCDGSISTSDIDVDSGSLFLELAQDELLVSFGNYRMNYLIAAILAFTVSSIAFVASSIGEARKEDTRTTNLIGLAVIAHCLSFFATSFIEEEHEFWFFVTITACILSSLGSKRSLRDRLGCLSVAAVIRVMRGWAHNGQKDFPNSSMSSYLAQHSTTTTLLVYTTYLSVTAIAGVLFKISTDGSKVSSRLEEALQSFGVEESSTLARIGYVLGGFSWLIATIVRRHLPIEARKHLDTVRLSTLSLLLMSLTRSTNIPLFLLFWVQHFALVQLAPSISPIYFAFLSVAFQFCSFFALGGSNSLATVDLSQAYNGLDSYSFVLVGLLTYVSNFSGPIFFAFSSRALLPSRSSHTIFTTTFFALSLSTLAISAVHFRYHLFAFTVFSPAVLYRGGWWISVHLITNEVLSRLFMY